MNDLSKTPPKFIETSPTEVEKSVISSWETISNTQLAPGQAERPMINLITYRETLLRIGFQWTCEQNLVNFARRDRLDQIGVIFNSPRLGIQAALATVRFSIEELAPGDIAIPSGTLVRGGDINFQTLQELIIPAGDNTVDGVVQAAAGGPSGNGVTVTQMVDDGLPINVEGLTLSSGGAVAEDDEHYRDRLRDAAGKVSGAGPRSAYIGRVKEVSQLISDVAVIMPYSHYGGQMRLYLDIYVLTVGGLPSTELLGQVQEKLDRDDVIPMCDIPIAKSPIAIAPVVKVEIIVLKSYTVSDVTARANAALIAYGKKVRCKLGVNIVLEQITAAVMVEGVYAAKTIEPTSDINVTGGEWASPVINPVIVRGTNEG